VKVLAPYARAVKYALLRHLAERRVRNHNDGQAFGKQPMAYVIGCGRSGTTILGKTLGEHPDLHYFFEPKHLWFTVDPITDATNLHHVGECKFILDAPHCTEEARRRFHLLFLKPALRAGAAWVVDKTPANTVRIGYLESLKEDARYIHIVRDGVDVVRSITRLSRDNSYRIAGQRDRNRWWGRKHSKWRALSCDGISASYFPEEVPLLDNYQAKAAYEWLMSLGEVNRWRKHLGNRLLEIKYDGFTSDPRGTIAAVCDFLGIRKPIAWIEQALPRIDSTRHNQGPAVLLPPAMCAMFNHWQTTYGFEGRATPIDAKHPLHAA
jgi:hypothetical protein